MSWTTGLDVARLSRIRRTRSSLGRPLPPPLLHSAIILRYRALTTWALSIGRCAPASCAFDFGIGKEKKRFDQSIRTIKIRAQIARIDATCATDGEFESFI